VIPKGCILNIEEIWDIHITLKNMKVWDGQVFL
jgi:hypothetical protein